MRTLQVVGLLLSMMMLLFTASTPLTAQDPATGINVTTWQQDDLRFALRAASIARGET